MVFTIAKSNTRDSNTSIDEQRRDLWCSVVLLELKEEFGHGISRSRMAAGRADAVLAEFDKRFRPVAVLDIPPTGGRI